MSEGKKKMATLQEQEQLAGLLRQVDDAHYRLYLALFKFNALANYLETLPESAFEEVEAAIMEVQETLTKVCAAMATYTKGVVCDREGNPLFNCRTCNYVL